MGTEQPPLAFLYDRHATLTRTILDLRLDACHRYALARGWERAGAWIDTGDQALSDHDRPRYDDLRAALRRAADTGRAAVCLVHDWDRLTRDRIRLSGMRDLLHRAGGWTETADGETTLSPACLKNHAFAARRPGS